MGKKGAKRKTIWRTLSLGDDGVMPPQYHNSVAALSNGGADNSTTATFSNGYHQSRQKYARERPVARRDGDGGHDDTGSGDQTDRTVDTNSSPTRNHNDSSADYASSYRKYRTSNYNPRHHYNNNSYGSKIHHTSSTSTAATTNNSHSTKLNGDSDSGTNHNNSSTITNGYPHQQHHHNHYRIDNYRGSSRSSDKYSHSSYNNNNNNNHHHSTAPPSYRRRPFNASSQSNTNSRYSSRYHQRSSYNANNNDTSDKENTTNEKPLFNEDEYTRITTPRQDVLFKKGYLSRPKVQSTNTTPAVDSAGNPLESSSGGVSVISTEESVSPADATPDNGDMFMDADNPFLYSGFYDQNGLFYVNPFVPNGFDAYSNMMMMPFAGPPFSISPEHYNVELEKPYGGDGDVKTADSIDSHNENQETQTATTTTTDEAGDSLKPEAVAKDLESNARTTEIQLEEKTSEAQPEEAKSDEIKNEVTNDCDELEAAKTNQSEAIPIVEEERSPAATIQPGFQMQPPIFPPFYYPFLYGPPPPYLPMHDFDPNFNYKSYNAVDCKNYRYKKRKRRPRNMGNSTGVSTTTTDYSDNDSTDTEQQQDASRQGAPSGVTPIDNVSRTTLNTQVSEFVPRKMQNANNNLEATPFVATSTTPTQFNVEVEEFHPRNYNKIPKQESQAIVQASVATTNETKIVTATSVSRKEDIKTSSTAIGLVEKKVEVKTIDNKKESPVKSAVSATLQPKANLATKEELPKKDQTNVKKSRNNKDLGLVKQSTKSKAAVATTKSNTNNKRTNKNTASTKTNKSDKSSSSTSSISSSKTEHLLNDSTRDEHAKQIAIATKTTAEPLQPHTLTYAQMLGVPKVATIAKTAAELLLEKTPEVTLTEMLLDAIALDDDQQQMTATPAAAASVIEPPKWCKVRSKGRRGKVLPIEEDEFMFIEEEPEHVTIVEKSPHPLEEEKDIENQEQSVQQLNGGTDVEGVVGSPQQNEATPQADDENDTVVVKNNKSKNKSAKKSSSSANRKTTSVTTHLRSTNNGFQVIEPEFGTANNGNTSGSHNNSTNNNKQAYHKLITKTEAPVHRFVANDNIDLLNNTKDKNIKHNNNSNNNNKNSNVNGNYCSSSSSSNKIKTDEDGAKTIINNNVVLCNKLLTNSENNKSSPSNSCNSSKSLSQTTLMNGLYNATKLEKKKHHTPSSPIINKINNYKTNNNHDDDDDGAAIILSQFAKTKDKIILKEEEEMVIRVLKSLNGLRVDEVKAAPTATHVEEHSSATSDIFGKNALPKNEVRNESSAHGDNGSLSETIATTTTTNTTSNASKDKQTDAEVVVSCLISNVDTVSIDNDTKQQSNEPFVTNTQPLLLMPLPDESQSCVVTQLVRDGVSNQTGNSFDINESLIACTVDCGYKTNSSSTSTEGENLSEISSSDEEIEVSSTKSIAVVAVTAAVSLESTETTTTTATTVIAPLSLHNVDDTVSAMIAENEKSTSIPTECAPIKDWNLPIEDNSMIIDVVNYDEEIELCGKFLQQNDRNHITPVTIINGATDLKHDDGGCNSLASDELRFPSSEFQCKVSPNSGDNTDDERAESPRISEDSGITECPDALDEAKGAFMSSGRLMLHSQGSSSGMEENDYYNETDDSVEAISPTHFPITEAVSRWLQKKKKEKTPDPIFHLPSNNTDISQHIEKCSLSAAEFATDVDYFTNSDSDTEEAQDAGVAASTLRDTQTNSLSGSLNWKGGHLRASSVDRESTHDRACKSVAAIHKSDTINSYCRNQPATIDDDEDILSFWENDPVLLSSCDHTEQHDTEPQWDDRDLDIYDSVYGRSIDYANLVPDNPTLGNNILYDNNGTFSTTTIVRPSYSTRQLQQPHHHQAADISKFNTTTVGGKNNVNNIHHPINAPLKRTTTPTNLTTKTNDNVTNDTNFKVNNENCLKPPEVCCLLM